MQEIKLYSTRIKEWKKDKIKFTAKTFILSQILCLGFLNLGFGLGYPSPTLRELLRLKLLDITTYPTFVSLYVVGIAVGNMLSIPASKYLGRKLTVILSSLFGALGWVLIAGGTGPEHLLVGRFLTGSAGGFGAPIIAIYIGEIAPVNARGFLSNFQGLYELLGTLLVYLFGIFLSFRWLAVVGLVLILVQVSLTLLHPYSPVWLYSRGLERMAKKVLISVRKEGENVSQEILAIKSALQVNEKRLSIQHYVRVIFVKYRLKALFLGIFLALGFINTGVDIINSYTAPLLENSKVIDPNVIAICVPIFGLLSGILNLFLIEPFGRKPLMLVSTSVITLMMISLMGYFFLIDNLGVNCTNIESEMNGTESTRDVCKWIIFWPALSLAVLKFGYQFGWGSVFYVLLGEMFPIRIKEFGSGFTLFVLNVHGVTVLTIFPYISEAIGNGFTFLILVILNFVACILIFLFLPETKGLQTDEIEEIFQESSILCGIKQSSNSYTLEHD